MKNKNRKRQRELQDKADKADKSEQAKGEREGPLSLVTGTSEPAVTDDPVLDEYLTGPMAQPLPVGANAVAAADEEIDVTDLLIGEVGTEAVQGGPLWEGYELEGESEPGLLEEAEGPAEGADGEQFEEEEEDLNNDDDDDDDEELDEEELSEEEALFNVACSAIEQGAELTWAEVVAWLVASPVLDMRLGLLCGLLIKSDMPCSGASVLAVLHSMGMGELVTEAQTSCLDSEQVVADLSDLDEQPRRASELRKASGNDPSPEIIYRASDLAAASAGNSQPESGGETETEAGA